MPYFDRWVDAAAICSAAAGARMWPVQMGPVQMGKGGMMMRQTWMICAALTVGLAAVPSTAQQTASDQSSPPQQSSAEVPPPPPVPPPLPPMPSTRHRWVSVGHHSTAHHATAHHSTAHHSKAHHRTTRHSRGRHHEAALSPAAKTMRWCANMTPHAMMRHSACKAMVHAYRQEATSDRKSRHHHKASAKRHHRKETTAEHRHSRHSRR